MAADRNWYAETLARMEPDISAVDLTAGAASLSISARRIADALERLASPPTPLSADAAVNNALEAAAAMIEHCGNGTNDERICARMAQAVRARKRG